MTLLVVIKTCILSEQTLIQFNLTINSTMILNYDIFGLIKSYIKSNNISIIECKQQKYTNLCFYINFLKMWMSCAMCSLHLDLNDALLVSNFNWKEIFQLDQANVILITIAISISWPTNPKLGIQKLQFYLGYY